MSGECARRRYAAMERNETHFFLALPQNGQMTTNTMNRERAYVVVVCCLLPASMRVFKVKTKFMMHCEGSCDFILQLI